MCSVYTLIKKANKGQEGKVEDQERAQVLSFAPEDTWLVMGQEQRARDVLCQPQGEEKQEHALETCDNASWFWQKKIGKIIGCRYSATITVLFFPPSIIKIKQNKEQFFSETNSKAKNNLTGKILSIVPDYSLVL